MSTSTILLEAGLSQNEINTLDGELIKIIEKFYQPIEIKHMPRNLLLQGANALLEAFKEDEMLKDSINKSESGFSEEEKALLTKINHYLKNLLPQQQIWALEKIKSATNNKFGPPALALIEKMFNEKKALLLKESNILMEYEQSLKNKIPLDQLLVMEKFQIINKKIEKINSALNYHNVQTETEFLQKIKPLINEELNRQKELLLLKTLYVLTKEDQKKRLYSKLYQSWISNNLQEAKNIFLTQISDNLPGIFS